MLIIIEIDKFYFFLKKIVPIEKFADGIHDMVHYTIE